MKFVLKFFEIFYGESGEFLRNSQKLQTFLISILAV